MEKKMEIPKVMNDLCDKLISSIYDVYENQLYFELLKLKENKLFLLESNICFNLSHSDNDWRNVSYIRTDSKDCSVMVGLLCDEDEDNVIREYEVKFNTLDLNIIKEIYTETYRELYEDTSFLNRDIVAKKIN